MLRALLLPLAFAPPQDPGAQVPRPGALDLRAVATAIDPGPVRQIRHVLPPQLRERLDAALRSVAAVRDGRPEVDPWPEVLRLHFGPAADDGYVRSLLLGLLRAVCLEDERPHVRDASELARNAADLQDTLSAIDHLVRLLDEIGPLERAKVARRLADIPGSAHLVRPLIASLREVGGMARTGAARAAADELRASTGVERLHDALVAAFDALRSSERFEDALAVAEELARRRPPAAHEWAELALEYARQGLEPQADECARRARAAGATDATLAALQEWRGLLGLTRPGPAPSFEAERLAIRAARVLGMRTAAVLAADALLGRRPHDSRAHVLRAWLGLRAREPLPALRGSLEHAWSLAPHDVELVDLSFELEIAQLQEDLVAADSAHAVGLRLLERLPRFRLLVGALERFDPPRARLYGLLLDAAETALGENCRGQSLAWNRLVDPLWSSVHSVWHHQQRLALAHFVLVAGAPFTRVHESARAVLGVPLQRGRAAQRRMRAEAAFAFAVLADDGGTLAALPALVGSLAPAERGFLEACLAALRAQAAGGAPAWEAAARAFAAQRQSREPDVAAAARLNQAFALGAAGAADRADLLLDEAPPAAANPSVHDAWRLQRALRAIDRGETAAGEAVLAELGGDGGAVAVQARLWLAHRAAAGDRGPAAREHCRAALAILARQQGYAGPNWGGRGWTFAVNLGVNAWVNHARMETEPDVNVWAQFTPLLLRPAPLTLEQVRGLARE